MTYGQFRHRRELFTNIPLDENIDIYVDQLFGNNDTVEGFTKSELFYKVRTETTTILGYKARKSVCS